MADSDVVDNETGKTDGGKYGDIMSDGAGMTITEDSPRRIPGGKGGTLTPFNSERARQASLRRHELYRRTSEWGMVKGVFGDDAPLDREHKLAAYGQIVSKQAIQAVTKDDFGRYNTAAARFVREAIGADVGAPARHGDNGPGGSTTVIIGDDVARAWFDRYRR